MRTKDDVMLLGTGKCAVEGCISSWAKICRVCNLSLCGAHVEAGKHSCGQFQRAVSFEGKRTPGSSSRGSGERGESPAPPLSEKEPVTDPSVPSNGKNGKHK